MTRLSSYAGFKPVTLLNFKHAAKMNLLLPL